jgi:hypothetical protein
MVPTVVAAAARAVVAAVALVIWTTKSRSDFCGHGTVILCLVNRLMLFLDSGVRARLPVCAA